MTRNQLLDDAEAYTTADVIDRIEPPKMAGMDVKAYMRDRAMRGETFSPAMSQAMERSPDVEPNMLTKLLGMVPESAMIASNFLGPKIRLPLRPRPMSNQALHDIGQAQYAGRYVIDPMEQVPLDTLKGAHYSPEKVGPLAGKLRESGWLEPMVVDRDGGIIEGQHRLRALHELGEQTAPVHRIRELETGKLEAAASSAGLPREQARQIAGHIAEIIDKEGVAALAEYAAPRGFEAAWTAAVAAANKR